MAKKIQKDNYNNQRHYLKPNSETSKIWKQIEPIKKIKVVP